MTGQPLWTPPPAETEQARITELARYASIRTGHDLTGGYRTLWEWSVRDIDGFWSAVWDHFGLPARGSSPRWRPRPCRAACGSREAN